MFRVYSGPRGSKPLTPADKARHLYKEFTSLDEAVGWAHHVKASGRVALLIEGDDGTHIDMRDLASELHRRENEQGAPATAGRNPGVH
jgi:hypothetical protein